MSTSAHTFIPGQSATPRSSDFLLAWSDAADDAQAAYAAWRDADRSDQPDAFVVYRAALDREEAAARALQANHSRERVTDADAGIQMPDAQPSRLEQR
jgi:hypothetical protein